MKAVCLIISLVTAVVLFVFYDDISDLVYYFWDKLKDFVLLLTITILLIRDNESEFWKASYKIGSAFFGCRLGVQLALNIFPSLDSQILFNYLFYGSWFSVLCIIFYDELVKLYYKVLILFARFKMRLK